LFTAPVAVAADAVSFAVAAILLLATRRPDPAPAPARRLVRSVREGLAGFVERPDLWAPTAALGTHALFYGGIVGLYVLYLVRDLGLTPSLLGLILAVATFGPVLAALGAAPVTRRLGQGWTQVAAAGLFSANLLIPLASGPLWLVIVLLILARSLVGLGAVFLNITRAGVRSEAA